VAGRIEDYAIIGGMPDYGASAPRRTGGPAEAAAMSGHPLPSQYRVSGLTSPPRPRWFRPVTCVDW
jgi:hypothetical protein